MNDTSYLPQHFLDVFSYFLLRNVAKELHNNELDSKLCSPIQITLDYVHAIIETSQNLVLNFNAIAADVRASRKKNMRNHRTAEIEHLAPAVPMRNNGEIRL